MPKAPDNLSHICARAKSLAMTPLSIVMVSNRSLLATTRPFKSNMRPRSGVSLIVRVRTSWTRTSKPGASIACKNHKRTQSNDDRTSATDPNILSREAVDSVAISEPPMVRATPNDKQTQQAN